MCGVERPERAIDEVNGAGLAGPRPSIDTGEDPRRESGNDVRLRRRQGAGLRGDGCRRLLTGEGEGIFDFEKISGRPGRTGGDGGLQEGSTRMKIGRASKYNVVRLKPDPTSIRAGADLPIRSAPRRLMPIASWLFIRGSESIWIERLSGNTVIIAGPGHRRQQRRFFSEEQLQRFQMRLADKLAGQRWFLWAYNGDRRSRSRGELVASGADAIDAPFARTSPRGIRDRARNQRPTR